MTRRRFPEVATLALFPSSSEVHGGGAAPGYELLVRGGHVMDPAGRVNARRDLAVAGGCIAAVEQRIPPASARRVIDARGLYVVPGLVDLHLHIGPPGHRLGVALDDITPLTGLTAAVSAGDVGHEAWKGYRSGVLQPLRTRAYAFLHISRIGLTGFPEPEMIRLADADVERAAEACAADRDLLLGIKVRESKSVVGEHGLEPLRRAVAAAEMAGGGARVMCHFGNAPGDLSDLLDLLRPGDILTHAYNGAANNLLRDGRLLPAAREAKARGVIFDVGHGGGSFDFTVAEAALDQGLLPDTLSSDLHEHSIRSAGMPYLPWVMSKFLRLGMRLEEVVAMSTLNPARIIDRVPGMGTLSVGAPADVTLLEMVEQDCVFHDTKRNQRTGSVWLRPAGVIRGGTWIEPVPASDLPYPGSAAPAHG